MRLRKTQQAPSLFYLFSLQTQLYTLTMPVQPSYNTEAAQPHLPAQAGGKPPSCTPCTLCVPDNSLGLSLFVCSQAWHLYPSLTVRNLCFINYYTYSLVSITHHRHNPTTSRKSLWFGDRKPLWSLNFEIALLLAIKPWWQPCHISNIISQTRIIREMP